MDEEENILRIKLDGILSKCTLSGYEDAEVGKAKECEIKSNEEEEELVEGLREEMHNKRNSLRGCGETLFTNGIISHLWNHDSLKDVKVDYGAREESNRLIKLYEKKRKEEQKRKEENERNKKRKLIEEEKNSSPSGKKMKVISSVLVVDNYSDTDSDTDDEGIERYFPDNKGIERFRILWVEENRQPAL